MVEEEQNSCAPGGLESSNSSGYQRMLFVPPSFTAQHPIPGDIRRALPSAPLLTHTAATPALSRPPSHGMTHNSQRVSLKTQVRSCHFSAQNRAGLLISFSVGAEVLTVALRWALPLPQRSVSILIPPGLRWSLQEHRFLCPPRVLPPWSFAPLSLELTPLDHHSALRHSPRWVSTQLSPVRGPPLSTLSPTHTHVLDFIHPLSFVFT